MRLSQLSSQFKQLQIFGPKKKLGLQRDYEAMMTDMLRSTQIDLLLTYGSS